MISQCTSLNFTALKCFCDFLCDNILFYQWSFLANMITVEPGQRYQISVFNIPKPELYHSHYDVSKNVTIPGELQWSAFICVCSALFLFWVRVSDPVILSYIIMCISMLWPFTPKFEPVIILLNCKLLSCYTLELLQS